MLVELLFSLACATALYDEAGLYFAKKCTHLKLGDMRFLPDSDDMLSGVHFRVPSWAA